MIPVPAGLCDDESCTCRGTGVLSIEQLLADTSIDLEQLQADGAQESPPRLALPSEDDELALRYRDGDR